MPAKKKTMPLELFEAALREARIDFAIHWFQEKPVCKYGSERFPAMALLTANGKTFLATYDHNRMWRVWRPSIQNMRTVPVDEALGAAIAAIEAN